MQAQNEKNLIFEKIFAKTQKYDFLAHPVFLYLL
jgi:hypothetical protein